MMRTETVASVSLNLSKSTESMNELRVAVDIGGTFTDTVLVDGQNRILATSKTATTPADPAVGALDGVKIVLSEAEADWGAITGFIHGTTLATNALIERRGARVATITTEGFRDILEIAYERRYSQYDINLEKPDLIVPRSRAFTIGGRMSAQGQELSPLDLGAVDDLVRALKKSSSEAVAICLLHSYANGSHEQALTAALQKRLPDLVVSMSHQVSPEAREFDRLCTTIANAYIQPLMAGYLRSFQQRFGAAGLRCPILMMTAGGGMTTVETAMRLPIRLVESGPAGGATLAAVIAAETDAPEVLSFDMGGTTAKLCLIDGFRPQTARKFEIARAARFIKGSGMPVRIPVTEMIEIGAGGGSVASVDRLGRLQVGPESAGSDPGPAAFGRGGDAATVTDADVAQGLIDPAYFAEGRLAIDQKAAETALHDAIGKPLRLDAAGAARGVSGIVDESMASAGRMHAVESGKDLATRVMIAFGGNGPLHATRVARQAGVRRILVPLNPGVGSAVGFLFAPVSFEIVQSRYATLETLCVRDINRFFDEMIEQAEEVVRAGAPTERLTRQRQAFMRYKGQGHEIEIELPDRALSEADIIPIRLAFEAEYAAQFSRAVPGMTVEILNWAVVVRSESKPFAMQAETTGRQRAIPVGERQIMCDLSGVFLSAALFERSMLKPGDFLEGPALIVEPQTTTFVSADFEARVDSVGNIWLDRQEEAFV